MSKPIKTKDRIYKEAAILFSEKGYAGTSMQEIARRVNISKPAIYHHFPNKLELFEGLVNSVIEEDKRTIRGIALSNKSPIEKLIDIVIKSFASCKKHPELSRFMYDVATGSLRTEISCDHLEMVQEQSQHLQNIFKEGIKKQMFRPDIKIEDFTLVFIGTLNMYLMGFIKGYLHELDNKRALTLVNLIINGMGTNTTKIIQK